MATAKHFPGHGSADRDSHGRLPVIHVDLATLLERDLLPYRILAREGVTAVMSGHLAFPDILGDLTPASLSPFLLRNVLRERLGFRGMVVTDDMEMEGALNGTLDVAVACRLALEAGNDLLLLSHSPPSQERVWTALAAAMRREPALPGGGGGGRDARARAEAALPRPPWQRGTVPRSRAGGGRHPVARRGGALPPERGPGGHAGRGGPRSLAARARRAGAAVRPARRVLRGGSRAVARRRCPRLLLRAVLRRAGRRSRPGCPGRSGRTTRWSSASPTSTASRCSFSCATLGRACW